MAALVFVGAMTAGCSGDDLTAETPQLPDTTNGTVTMKINASLSENASTRVLNPDFMRSFTDGEQIVVIYKNTADETVMVTSAALNFSDMLSSNSANFTVTLTNPQPNTPVRYIYPASRAAAFVAPTTAPNDDATINYAALNTQDGTFASFASDLDLAVFDGEMTAQAVLPAATLENPLTIGKFTIENSGGTDVTNTITKLTISDGSNTYTVSRAAADGPIYVAMKPMDNKTVTVSVTSNNNKYSDKSVSVTELAKNTIYPINVSLTARYPFAATDTKLSSEDIGSVIGADGNIFFNAAAATAATTTAVAMITYVGAAGTADASSTGYKGLALALTDANGGSKTAWCSQTTATCLTAQYSSDYTNDMAGIANTNYLIDHAPAGHTHTAASVARNYNGGTHPAGTSAWFLPSAGQWDKMINACKNVLGNKNSYEDLRDGFSNAGGTNLQSKYYWSATESSDYGNTVYAYPFIVGNWAYAEKHREANYVRSALAF